MLFTIAIPTYNNADTILNTINSCMAQKTDIEYEVLVVNNNSNDGTLNILKNIPHSKIRIINNSNTVSMFENHNICLNEAFGDYVLFCHADDTLENNAIGILYNRISKRGFPNKYVLFGHSYFRDFSPNIKNGGWAVNEGIIGEYACLPFLYGGLTPSGTCYSRKTFLELNGFISVNHHIPFSDWSTMIYLAQNGFMFEMIDDLYFIRTYASTLDEMVKFEDILDATDASFGWFVGNHPSDRIRNALNLSSGLSNPPLMFYFAMSNYSKFRDQLLKILFIRFIKHPLLIRNVTFLKILERLLFKNLRHF